MSTENLNNDEGVYVTPKFCNNLKLKTEIKLNLQTNFGLIHKFNPRGWSQIFKLDLTFFSETNKLEL